MKHVLIVTFAFLAVTGWGDELTNLFGYHPGMEVPSELRSRIESAPVGEKLEIIATNNFCGFSNVTLFLGRNGDGRIKSLSTLLWMTDASALTNVRSNVIAAIGTHGVTNKNNFASFKRGVCEIIVSPVERKQSGSNLLTMSLLGPRSIAERDLANARLEIARPNKIVGSFGQRLGSRVAADQDFGLWSTNRGEIKYTYSTNNTTFETNVIVVARIDPVTGLIVEIWGGQEYYSREKAEGIYERVRGLIESRHGRLYRHPELPMIGTLNQKGNNVAIWDIKGAEKGSWGVTIQYIDSAAAALEREEDF